ncbi:MAG: OB-fold domain-containing protein [Thalassovita sp.]
MNACNACDGKAYFPPRPFCPTCGSRDVTVIEASGKAAVFHIINHLPAPGHEPPFTVAVVMLDEGVKMVANIMDCPADPEA